MKENQMFGIVEKANKENISIWCEGVQPHADMKAGSKVVYTTITGKDENNEYTWTQFSSFVGSFDQAGIQNAVDSLLIQANDGHHVFIEDFYKNEDGSFEAVMGS